MATTSIITRAADVARYGRESEENRTAHVCVWALVDTTAPKSLVLPVRDAFDPRLPGGEVRVFALGSSAQRANLPLPDVAVVIVAERPDAAAPEITDLAFEGVPVAVVVESVLDAPRLSLGASAAPLVNVLAATNPEVLTERLAEWLVGATPRGITLAANFAFCRRTMVRKLIKDYAVENAMGTAKLGNSTDFASVAANQARLALAIASVNGEPLALRRIPEVLAAVGAGYGSRAMANSTAGRLPLVGNFFKAGFDFLGTEATGMALQARHDKRERRASGEEVPPSAITRAAQRVVHAVRARQGTVVRSSEGKTVRMLSSGTGDGVLVYEQEGAS